MARDHSTPAHTRCSGVNGEMETNFVLTAAGLYVDKDFTSVRMTHGIMFGTSMWTPTTSCLDARVWRLIHAMLLSRLLATRFSKKLTDVRGRRETTGARMVICGGCGPVHRETCTLARKILTHLVVICGVSAESRVLTLQAVRMILTSVRAVKTARSDTRVTRLRTPCLSYTGWQLGQGRN